VAGWRDSYLKVYDATAAGYIADATLRTNRRAAIEKTFRWLMSLSESYWDN
jgi:hypothetical protein